MSLTEEELERYSRQLPVIGREAQVKLKQARVLIVGVGGLGSAAALYLAAAGVGTLVLVDPELVELSNLNRQVLYTTGDVGRRKVEVAAERLAELNPCVRVEPVAEPLTRENVDSLVRRADVVLDCLDNWETRHLLNEACVRSSKPLVHAGVEEMRGQMMVVIPGRGPCLACVFERMSTRRGVPILGTVAGVMGVLQATEAIKLITGVGQPAVGRLIIYDAAHASFYEVKVKRRTDCPVCSQHV